MDYTDLYNFQTSAGVVVPASDDVLEGVQEKFRAIFGSDIDLGSTTPVGRLVEAMAVVIRTSIGVTAQNSNQFNLASATGIYLDSIGALFNVERKNGTKTRVQLTLGFTTKDTVVPSGSLVMDDKGNQYATDTSVVPSVDNGDGSWEAEVTATAVEYGDVPGDAGTITKILNPVLGWVSVTNPFAAFYVGNLVESDAEFRQRIRDTRPIGVGFASSLVSSLRRIDGVYSANVLENNDYYAKMDKGVYIPGHSIFICVYAAESSETDEAIANAIVRAKPAGTGIVTQEPTGSTKVEMTVKVDDDAYNMATVVFFRPEIVYRKVRVIINAQLYAGMDVVSDVKSAVQAHFQSLGVGEDVRSSSISYEVLNKVASIGVVAVFVTDPCGNEAQTVTTYAFQKAAVKDDEIIVESN